MTIWVNPPHEPDEAFHAPVFTATATSSVKPDVSLPARVESPTFFSD